MEVIIVIIQHTDTVPLRFFRPPIDPCLFHRWGEKVTGALSLSPDEQQVQQKNNHMFPVPPD